MSAVGYYKALMNKEQGGDEYPFQVYGNVKLWWDFSDPSKITLSGSEITEIEGRDSSGVIGNPSNANSPTLLTSAQNGLNVADFTASNYELIRSATSLNITSEGSVFIVVKVDSDPPPASFNTGMWSISTQGGHYPFTNGIIYEYFGTTVRKTISGFAEDLSVYNVYHVDSTNGSFQAFLNNNSIFSTSSNTFENIQSVDIGASTPSLTSSGRWLDGIIGELIILDRILNSTERGDMVSYLTNKWGL